MNRDLAFPVFLFGQKDNMIFAYFNERSLRSTNEDFVKMNGFVEDNIIRREGNISSPAHEN